MSWLDFIVLTLAASAVLDVWFNGSIFADWRAFFQDGPAADPVDAHVEPVATKTSDEAPLPLLMQIAERIVPDWVVEMLNCPFCFSYHAPWMVALVCFLPADYIAWGWVAFLLKLPAYSLAATRLGNLINAWAPKEAKYKNE